MSKKSEPSKLSTWINKILHKRIRLFRFISQLTFFVLINGVFLGIAKLPLPVPIHVPTGSPFATVWGGFTAIQFLLSQGQFPFLALGVFFITGSLVGKLFCGWVCPVGFWQDLLAMIPAKKIKISKEDNRTYQEISGFIMWLAIGITIIFGLRRLSNPGLIDDFWTRMPFDAFDPAGALFVTWYYILSWNIFPGTDYLVALKSLDNLVLFKSVILLAVSFAAIKIPRFYCRWICPTGALLGYCSKYSALKVTRNPLKCVDNCKECESACPMGVPISEYGLEGITDTMCISCGDCIDACPDAMAFTLKV